MKVYLCKWPNGTISFLTANSKRELYILLDCEADPDEAEVYKLANGFHIATDVINKKISTYSCGDYYESKWEKIKF